MGIKRFMSRAVRKLIMLTKEEKMIPIPEPVNTNRLLENKIALITGGSGGIGMGIAKAFLNSGAKVIIAGTNEEKLNNCLRKLTTGGGGKTTYSKCA